MNDRDLTLRPKTYAWLLGLSFCCLAGSTWADDSASGTTATGVVSPNTYVGATNIPAAQKMAQQSLTQIQTQMNQGSLTPTSLIQDNSVFHSIQTQPTNGIGLNPTPLPYPVPLPIAPILGGGGDLQLLEQELVQVNKDIKNEEAVIEALSAACRTTTPPCDPDKACPEMVRTTCNPKEMIELQQAKQRLAELLKERAVLVKEIHTLKHPITPIHPIAPVPCGKSLSGDITPCPVGPVGPVSSPFPLPVKHRILPILPVDPFTTAPQKPVLINGNSAVQAE